MPFCRNMYCEITLYFLIAETLYFGSSEGNCVLIETPKEHEEHLLKLIQPLKDSQFEVTEGSYKYHVKICGKVDGHTDNVGAVQFVEDKKEYSLGMFDEADISGGTNWILLTYHNGSEYSKHCNGTDRIAQIMITCDPEHLKGEFRMLEEKRRQLSSFCFYMFELGSKVACTEESKPSGLSSGAIFCIIFITFFAAYIILGFIYKRVVVGAKGLEQIPNYSFWREFGNLQADACDFVCRCGPRHESQAYRGIDDRLKDEEERDEQLLNM